MLNAMTEQDIFNILTIIGLVFTYVSFFHNITAQKLYLWFLIRADTINKLAYTTVVAVLSSLSVYFFIVFPLTKHIFDVKWALLLGVVAYFVFGMWLRILAIRKSWLGRLEKLHINVNRWAVVALLTGFWIISYPTQWLIPLILTCVYSVMMIIVYSRWRAGRIQSPNISRTKSKLEHEKVTDVKNYHRYRLKLANRDIASIEFNGQKVKSFMQPDNHSELPKLYIVKSKSEAIYIGQTTQNMRTRLRYGLKAHGKTGYYGYMWKDLDEVDILIWCFPSKSDKYVEAIEGELVYLFRNRTGKWPKYQMEIHFHNATEDEIKVTEAIFKESANRKQ